MNRAFFLVLSCMSMSGCADPCECVSDTGEIPCDDTHVHEDDTSPVHDTSVDDTGSHDTGDTAQTHECAFVVNTTQGDVSMDNQLLVELNDESPQGQQFPWWIEVLRLDVWLTDASCPDLVLESFMLQGLYTDSGYSHRPPSTFEIVDTYTNETLAEGELLEDEWESVMASVSLAMNVEGSAVRTLSVYADMSNMNSYLDDMSMFIVKEDSLVVTDSHGTFTMNHPDIYGHPLQF